MAANTSQIFGLTPNIGKSRVSAANTARDGSGSNISTCYTAGANGDLVLRFTCTESDATASSTSVTQVLRFWIFDGTNYFLYKELVMPNTSGSTSVASGTITYTIPGGLYLPTGFSIKVAATLGSATTGQVDFVIEGISY